MTIIGVPRNRKSPVPLDAPCYRCEGQWKLLLLTAEDRIALRLGRTLVAKCRRCGLTSCVTRTEVAVPSSA